MIIVDVGANHGEFSLEVAKRNPDCRIVAIEPIEVLRRIIYDSAEKCSIKNIDICACAIDQSDGYGVLNIATHSDWGVSTLLNFDQNKLQDEYWKTRDDMYFDTQEEVRVRTLSSILEEFNVSENNRVGFIKVDAQGLDLQVLMSAGDYVKYIDAGMLEISISTDLGLYEKEEYNLKSVLDWLEINGFEPYYLKPNDPASNEFNVYFNRVGYDHLEIEKELSLRGIDIYDGKFYWHFPSSKLLNIEHEYHELLERGRSDLEEIDKLNIVLNDTNNKLDLIRQEMEVYRSELEACRSKLINYDFKASQAIPWINNIQGLLEWLERSRAVAFIKFLSKYI